MQINFYKRKGRYYFLYYQVSVTCDIIRKDKEMERESEVSSLLNRRSTDGIHYDMSVSIRHSRMSVKPSASLHKEQQELSDVQGIVGREYPGLDSSVQRMDYINTGGCRRNAAM